MNYNTEYGNILALMAPSRENLFKKAYRWASRMEVSEPDSQLISRVIEYRIARQKEVLPPSALKRSRKDMLSLEENFSLAQLFGASELWITQGNDQFLPAAAAKEMLMRKDGAVIDEKAFTTFVADYKESMFERYGIYPLSAWDKQKWQYWDKKYYEQFFASIQVDNLSFNGHFNHIAYTIRNDVVVERLKTCCYQVNLKLTRAALKHDGEYFKNLS